MSEDVKLHVQEVQKQPQNSKTRPVNYTHTYAYIQIFGHGSRGETRSIFLHTDHRNYLFNCGEGIQRLVFEHRVKLTKIENIFITRPTWRNIGGLPGVALYFQDNGVSSVQLHGPEGSMGVMESTENFMTLNDLTLKSADVSKTYKDPILTVNYVLISKSRKEIECDDVYSDLPLENISLNDNQTRSVSETSCSPENKVKEKEPETKSKTTDLLIFICKIEKKLGHLDVQKCRDLGVPSGPLMGKLKAGEDVILADGTVIHSKDVIGENDEGPLFIVLECPDEEWMDLVIKNQAFEKYQNSGIGEKIACIAHLTPEKVLNNPKYKEWMQKFGPDTTHLIINELNTGYSGRAVYEMQHQLNLIHPKIFPLLQDQQKHMHLELHHENKFSTDETEGKKPEEKDLDASFLRHNLKVRRCKSLDIFHLRPKKGLTTEKNIKINPNVHNQDTMKIDGLADSLAELQTEISAKTKDLGDNIEEFPKIHMLGTGSCIPNKIRNVTGILFEIDEERSMLLDCGESTFHQIVRLLGETQANKVLRSLKAIYVSHLHADHHLGLIGILEEKKMVTNNPIFLIMPQQLMPFVHYYSTRCNKILDNCELVCNSDILLDHSSLTPTKLKLVLDALNLSEISTALVVHCPFAYAIALTLTDGRKICYSGDSMPCDGLQKLAHHSFLLIHEATMEDALESEAVARGHSTISQAINTGVKAKVNFTLLTHFSQRYAKLPLLTDTEESGNDYSNVGVAYDLMSISLSKLPLLPLFYKTLKVMFNEFREEVCKKAIKRGD
ncbi:ribonuclease Z, mitochondrial-like [Copidosoma floridanum]|uniref:ribonuclease Z, mitochondrial-like n=1 Tax=Copidosoma floridanum TaxID=29053 RepID=UPI0006C9BE9E|nr:ribonuclease Z, mitochondrial-like [Copidosoma floridanum]